MRTVHDIKQIESKGPWQSKSGGTLDVLFSLTKAETEQFLGYDNPEFDTIKEASGIDVRGLRSYTVSAIPKDSVGAKEWHKARSEYLFAPQGSATLHCVDLDGNEKTFTVGPQQAIIILPTILHTYTALEDNTKLQVICNTLYFPDQPATHDSFSTEAFYERMKELDATSH